MKAGGAGAPRFAHGREVKLPSSGSLGGQALVEGVFMRSPAGAAAAVRLPDGRIRARRLCIPLLSSRGAIWKRPVFRGAAALIDSLRLGLSALNWSAETSEGKKSGGGTVSTLLAMVLAVAIFSWLPLRLSQWVFPGAGSAGQFLVHLAAGLLRMLFFFLYLAGISLLPDVRRLFAYHGAEHQVIHAWEDGETDLARGGAGRNPVHPRCGTSFLLYAMVITILFYTLVDSAVVAFLKVSPGPLVRVLYHLPLVPLVMGLSYEVLKAADRHLETSAVARFFSAPGMMLQRLTTRPADRSMLEVAAVAAGLALGTEPQENSGVEVVEC